MATNKIKIRNRIRELLVDKTECGLNVYTSRPTPLWKQQLPAICITTKRSSFSKTSGSPVKTFTRKLDLVIYILAVSDENVEDLLDSIQEKVEQVLFANEYLSDPFNNVSDGNTDLLMEGIEPVSEETEVIIEGDIPLGCTTVNLTCAYENDWPKPADELDISEFIIANNRCDINQDNVFDMENTVNMRSNS